MHLKSLTLKGFKSFASATTLVFEPGITCVVGPNGSGKSNVVDAIAWVLGEQGVKALRGGKMEDVIFAGTPDRPALGRAEVALTIDNSDGALPIDFTEVTIRRLMFRSGESEYSINGSRCRLLDVQELMSDSGIGRELHVVVGQGQLDAVLAARPEDRRGFIEEAAGVLKHRKRKERALRKLEAMQANLARLQDLTAELRRQLGPLGRQAEVARQAQQVQADLRDARLRLLADDLATAQRELAAEVAEETANRTRRAEVDQALGLAQEQEGQLERLAAEQAPRLERVQETWYALAALEERLRGTASLAAERHRHLTAALAGTEPAGTELAGTELAGTGLAGTGLAGTGLAGTGSHGAGPGGSVAGGPEALEEQAKQAREQERVLREQHAEDLSRLRAATSRRTEVEAALATHSNAVMAAVRKAAERREAVVRVGGQLAALRSRVAAADDELDRLGSALAEARDRGTRAESDLQRLQEAVAGLDRGEMNLDRRHERAEAELAAAHARLVELRSAERAAEQDRSTWAARRDALALSLAPRDGAAALLSGSSVGDVTGVLGAVAGLLRVQPGWEAAVAAALGPVADAVAVASTGDAASALRHLRDGDAGRAGLLVALPVGGPVGVSVGDPGTGAETSHPGLASVTWVRDLVQATDPVRPALERALYDVAVVESLDEAVDLVARVPGVRAVTRAGDLIGAGWAVGGGAGTQSLLEVQGGVDDAAAHHDEAQRRQERLGFLIARARAEVDAAQEQVAAALAELHDSDAQMAAAAEQLGQLATAVRAARAETARLEQAQQRAQQARDRAGLARLEEQLAQVQAAAEPDEQDGAGVQRRDELAELAAQLRGEEVEARLSVRTGEERLAALGGRAQALEQQARSARQARERLAVRRSRQAEQAVVAEQVVRAARYALERIAVSLAEAVTERSVAQAERARAHAELLALRARSRELSIEVDRLTGIVHRDEVARAEQRLRIGAMEARSLDEHGVPPQELVAGYGPDVPVPAPEPGGDASPYDRSVQGKRAATAERALARLGRINPLALEEYAALEERSAFLTAQLEDVKATRRELLAIVRDVDERIHEVFRSAYDDTAREFGQVFATLFPGGEGRLVLTEPDDLLASGIEVLARPAGKKVSRLSLLSGGERSLTAIALLVAIFRARPSPFYVMDEVEAALDDRNLGRLLELLDGLRAASQLIVITHQKRTMEIADALYGVTMRGDGISVVVSQRLRERAPA